MPNFKIDFCNAKQHIAVLEIDLNKNNLSFYFKPNTPRASYLILMDSLLEALRKDSFACKYNNNSYDNHRKDLHILTNQDVYFHHTHIVFDKAITPETISVILDHLKKYQDKKNLPVRLALQSNYYNSSFIPKFFLDMYSKTLDADRFISPRNMKMLEQEFLQYYYYWQAQGTTTHHLIAETITNTDTTVDGKHYLVSEEKLQNDMLPHRCPDLINLSLTAQVRSNLGDPDFATLATFSTISLISMSTLACCLFTKKYLRKNREAAPVENPVVSLPASRPSSIQPS